MQFQARRRLADIAINLDIMKEYGLCGGSKSDTVSGGLTTPSYFPPPIPESTEEARTAFDLFTPTETFRGQAWTEVRGDIVYVANNYTSISTGAPSNRTGYAAYFGNSGAPIPGGTPADEEDTPPF